MNVHKIWEEYKKNKNIKLKESLVIQYLPLVKYVIGKLQIKISDNLEYDELLSIGCLGLIEAVEKFDPKFQVKFETYAISRIRGSIIDELRNRDILSRSVRKKLKELENVYLYLEKKLNRIPSEEEVAKHLKLTLPEFHKLLNKVSPITVLSLDEKYQDSQDAIFIKDTLEDIKSPNPEKIIEKKEVRKILKENISNLPENEKKILFLYYYEDLTLKEISAVLDISESRVCQLHSQIIIKLRAKIKENLMT